MSLFVALKFLSQLVTPPGLLASGLVVGGLLVIVGLRKTGKLIAVLAVAQMVAFTLTPVGDALMTPLEDEARAAAAKAPASGYEAIVVLGAGVVTATPPQRPEPQLTDSSDRLWYAARLFHRGLAPKIIVSGGSFSAQNGGSGQTEAEAMRDVLVAFGVPADRIVLEGMALNTVENIREVRRLIGTQLVALVTSGHHMPRALHIARVAGLDVGAFPTDWHVVPEERRAWDRYVPSIDALWNSTFAIREYLALMFDYRINSVAPVDR